MIAAGLGLTTAHARSPDTEGPRKLLRRALATFPCAEIPCAGVRLSDGAERQSLRRTTTLHLLQILSGDLKLNRSPQIRPDALERFLHDHPEWMPAELMSRTAWRDEPQIAAYFDRNASVINSLIDLDPRYLAFHGRDYDPWSATAIDLRRWPVALGGGDGGGVVVVAGGTADLQIGDRVVGVDIEGANKRVKDLDDLERLLYRSIATSGPDRVTLKVSRDGSKRKAPVDARLPLDLFAEGWSDRAPTCGPCCHGASKRECKRIRGEW